MNVLAARGVPGRRVCLVVGTYCLVGSRTLSWLMCKTKELDAPCPENPRKGEKLHLLPFLRLIDRLSFPLQSSL